MFSFNTFKYYEENLLTEKNKIWYKNLILGSTTSCIEIVSQERKNTALNK